jgi:hypothetical protein
MSYCYRDIGLWLGLAVVMMLTLVSCGSNKEKEPGVQSGDEITRLVRSYQTMREIGLAGKVEQFLAMRDSLTNGEIAEYFQRRGWVIDSAKVSGWAYSWPDVAGM